jgi:serine/threonine protein kinase
MQDDQMFLEELAVMKKLSHPYIIRYLGCGVMTEEDDGHTSRQIAIVRLHSSCFGPLLHTATNAEYATS